MDIWRLKIFRSVVDEKSFSKAAQAVHLSQPTISSHIKALEDHFDCRLLDRLEKKTIPTKAGELLYGYAGRILALYDETEKALAAFQGKISGRFIIGGSTIPAGYILPVIIGKFIKKYPEVTISMMVGDTEKIIRDILNHTLELGIVGARSEDKRILQHKFLDDEMCVIVPGNHRWANKGTIRFDELVNEPFIIREEGSGTRTSIEQCFLEKGLSCKNLNIVAELGNTQAVIQGIRSGIGVSILSTVAVQDDITRKTLCALTLKSVNLMRKFYLTRHKDRATSPLCLAFIDFIENIGSFKPVYI